MNYRHLSRLVEWSVVAAVVALHALIAVGSHQRPNLGWLQIAADAQPMALVTLIAAWALLGPGKPWVRIVVVPILLVPWATVMAGSDRRYFNPANSEFPFPFVVALAAFLAFTAIRLTGMRAIAILQGRSEPRPQFSILSLLMTTTLIAVSIGCLELLRPTVISADNDTAYSDFGLQLTRVESEATFGRLEILRGLVPSPASLRQFILSMTVAGSAITGLTVVLRPGAIWLRLAILALALPTLGVYLTHLAGTSDDAFFTRAAELTTGFAAVAMLVGISVLPLRLMGLRVSRSPTLRVGHAAEKPITQLQQSLPDSESNESLAHMGCRPTLKPAEAQA
jgi:hypothetical protein